MSISAHPVRYQGEGPNGHPGPAPAHCPAQRGLTEPQNLAEFILLTDALTVVKSWRFEPATREGVQVKYRQLLPVRDLVRANP